MNYRYAVARQEGMTEDKLAEVADAQSPKFTDEERAVLNFATRMVANDGTNTDAVFAELRTFYDDAQIVELTFFVSTLHGLNLFNNMLELEPEPEQMISQTAMADR